MSETNNQIYEIAFMGLDDKSAGEVENLILKHNGELKGVKISPRKLKLAYEIKKHSEAFFSVMRFTINGAYLKDINKALNLNNAILRFLIMKVDTRETSKPKKETSSRPDISVNPNLTSLDSSSPSQPSDTLSNEALEKKLEEILS